MRHVTRRELLKTAAVGAGTLAFSNSTRAQDGKRRVRVAAVQMHATLGEVDANLENAERWARLALREGAQWVVLPEFFTTAIAIHPSRLVNAYRPLDGDPMQLLKTLARDGQAYVGGSFLARSGADVFNTFVLATPNGQVFTHDKDFPTSNIESSVYAGGEDDEYVKELSRRGAKVEQVMPIPSRRENIKSAVFQLTGGPAVGAALCWEQCRLRTARRLTGQVDLILAASGWPFGGADVSRSNPSAGQDVLMARNGVQEAPRRLGRMVGAPVIHANLVGDVWTAASGARSDRLLRFAGESQIVDASGRTLARRAYAEGEGIVIAELEIGRVPTTEAIPVEASWTPEVSAESQTSWAMSGAVGRTEYLTQTRPRRNS
jgi:predicted amidohydrolase